jgi:hypothetical protein
VITPELLVHLIANVRARFRSETSQIKPEVFKEWTDVDDWAQSFAQLACDTFRRVLRIALAKARLHRFEPVEWALLHVQILIKEELGRVGPELLLPERARRVETLVTKQLHDAVESARTQTEMRDWRKNQPAAPLELPVAFKRLVQFIENLSGSATVIPDLDRKGSHVEKPFAAPGQAAAQQLPAVPLPHTHEVTDPAPPAKAAASEVCLPKAVRQGETVETLYNELKRVRTLYRDNAWTASQIRQHTQEELKVLWEWVDRIPADDRSIFLNVHDWDDGDKFIFLQITTLYKHAGNVRKKPAWATIRDWRKGYKSWLRQNKTPGVPRIYKQLTRRVRFFTLRITLGPLRRPRYRPHHFTPRFHATDHAIKALAAKGRMCPCLTKSFFGSSAASPLASGSKMWRRVRG